MANLPIAVQLYSVRHEAEQDLPGTLAKIRAMGCEGVEFAGWYGHSAAQIRTWLDAEGLRVAGAHVGIETLQGDQLEASVEFAHTLGNEFLIVPCLVHRSFPHPPPPAPSVQFKKCTDSR